MSFQHDPAAGMPSSDSLTPSSSRNGPLASFLSLGDTSPSYAPDGFSSSLASQQDPSPASPPPLQAPSTSSASSRGKRLGAQLQKAYGQAPKPADTGAANNVASLRAKYQGLASDGSQATVPSAFSSTSRGAPLGADAQAPLASQVGIESSQLDAELHQRLGMVESQEHAGNATSQRQRAWKDNTEWPAKQVGAEWSVTDSEPHIRQGAGTQAATQDLLAHKPLPSNEPRNVSAAPQRALPKREQVANRPGRLSRLQYSRADGATLFASSTPGWDTTTAGQRTSSVPSASVGSTSNANAPTLSAPNDSPQLQDVASMTDSQPSSRTTGQRELYLPALNGMRTAVEHASTLPSQAFLRKAERRASGANLLTTMGSDGSAAPEGKGSDAIDKSSNAIDKSSNVTDKSSDIVDTSTREMLTSRDSGADSASKQEQIRDTHELNSRGTAAHVPASQIQSELPETQAAVSSQMLAPQESIASIMNGSNVGRLSDATIAQLGALPGVEPASLLNANGHALSSKNVLTIALQKAQSAVLLDSANNVPEAILAYKQSVRLLQEVMERVSPKHSKGRKSNREEERRRLKVIHDTYAERIRLLSSIDSPEEDHGTPLSSTTADLHLDGRDTRPTSHGHSSSLTSVKTHGLGIQEVDDTHPATLDTPPPRIAISTDLGPSRAAESDQSDILSEPAMVPTAFGEKEGPGSSLQTPSASSGSRSRSTGLNISHVDEDLVTPSTPYFDIDPNLGSATDDSTLVNQPLAQSNHLSPSFATSLHRTRSAGSRSTSERSSRVSASLSNVPSAAAITDSEAKTSRRTNSVGSDASFQHLASRIPFSPFPSQSPNKAKAGGVPAHAEQSTNVSGQPSEGNSRPFTATSRSSPDAKTLLVSPSTAKGTISQRRKNALTGSPQVDDYEASPASTSQGVFPPFMQDSTDAPPDDTSFERHVQEAPSLAPSSRKRAVSQPSHRRPAIPASFMNAAPPVPKMNRKASMPFSTLQVHPQTYMGRTLSDKVSGTHPLPSPAASSYSGYHMLGTPVNVTTNGPLPDVQSFTFGDIFPTPLPSLQVGKPASFMSSTNVASLPWLGVGGVHLDAFPTVPSDKPLRPFHTMRQLLTSMERGAYITRHLFVPRDIWLQASNRLVALETKVRSCDLVTSCLESVENSGSFLIHDPHVQQPGLLAIHATTFLKQLDELDAILTEVRATLARKLSFVEQSTPVQSGSGLLAAGKKNNSNAFGSLSSKLSRSLDRMVAQSKGSNTLDSPTAYVDGLARMFAKASTLGYHLTTLFKSHHASTTKTEGYATLSDEIRNAIEFKLRKASDFFSDVVLRFVLRDVAILMDK